MNDERKKERLSIIENIVGNIEGYGEEHTDRRALDNIPFANEALWSILEGFLRNAQYNGYEASRLNLKEESIKALESIKESVDEILEECRNDE